MKSLISLFFLLACFHSQKTFAQDLILKECLDSDSVKECSQQKILNTLSESNIHTTGRYYAAKVSLNNKGKISTYLNYIQIDQAEKIAKAFKKAIKKIDTSCYNKTYTLKFWIDENSNFIKEDNFPAFPLVGAKQFATTLNESFKVPKDFEDSNFPYSCIISCTVDTNGSLVDGTETVMNPQENDYRISEAGLESFKKLLSIQFEPTYEDGKKVSGPIRFRFGHYKTYDATYEPGAITLSTGVGPYYAKGVLFFEEGKFDDAIENFNKALRIDGGYIDALYNRAATYFKLGNTEKACADWKKAALLGDEGSAGLFESNCASEIK